MLAHIGYADVVEASNARQAIELFETNPIDLVITDWNMPGPTGGHLIKRIRSMPGNESFPVLLMSGSRLGVQELVDIGIEPRNYLDKPFSLLDLEGRIVALTS